MNSLDSTEAEIESPPAVRFDDVASANAKPVQPIPTRGVAVWIDRAHQRAHQARQMLSGRTKALALVLVGGLAIGSLGGTMLVKDGSSSPDPAPVVQESTGETTAAQDATKDTGPNDETAAAQVSAMALQSAGKTSSRMRARRVPPPVQRGQRAYRVDVIR